MTCSPSSSGILDIECVLGTNSKYLIKEMSVIDTNSCATQHWLFKHSSSTVQNAKSRRVNLWLLRNYHQLSLDCGDVEYKEIERILNSLKFDIIYVKGEEKRQIIEKFIPQIKVINMENLGCPRLNTILNDYNERDFSFQPCCIYHSYLNPRNCTFNKIFALKKWFINNS